jgi:1-acyl-sn-glycerol-3-phosphate acyltransferase
VVFGKPFELPKGRRLNTELVQQCTDRIMKEIAVLLPEEYRGVYAELAASQPEEQPEGIGLT